LQNNPSSQSAFEAQGPQVKTSLDDTMFKLDVSVPPMAKISFPVEIDCEAI
jgi:hypothetical protein